MERDWVTVWAGREVNGYQGSSDLSNWIFSNEFPWLCETKCGLDFVVPDWNIVDGEWDMVEVGIRFEDLIDHFIETENCDDNEQWAIERRAIAISALERAIETLKAEPLRVMKPNP